ncbi:hypothetical protein AAF712_008536 [Marasmius tenuissimus]|uniref:Uncharacterized protein n=1 Tax=Marasmius tenuissimus TaxID=585030 RepID=A0ABR2ZTY5_9AGAR
MSLPSASSQTNPAQYLSAQHEDRREVDMLNGSHPRSHRSQLPCAKPDCQDRRAADADAIRRLKEKLVSRPTSQGSTITVGSMSSLEGELALLRRENGNLIVENELLRAKMAKARDEIGRLIDDYNKKSSRRVEIYGPSYLNRLTAAHVIPANAAGDAMFEFGGKRIAKEGDLDVVDITRAKRLKLNDGSAQTEEKE